MALSLASVVAGEKADEPAKPAEPAEPPIIPINYFDWLKPKTVGCKLVNGRLVNPEGYVAMVWGFKLEKSDVQLAVHPDIVKYVSDNIDPKIRSIPYEEAERIRAFINTFSMRHFGFEAPFFRLGDLRIEFMKPDCPFRVHYDERSARFVVRYLKDETILTV